MVLILWQWGLRNRLDPFYTIVDKHWSGLVKTMKSLGHEIENTSVTATALSDARQYLGSKPFEELHAVATTKHLERHQSMQLYKGYRLYAIDGSSLNLVSNNNLGKAFGRPASTGTKSAPQASFTVLELVNTGWICGYRLSKCDAGELNESKIVTAHLAAGDLLLADRLYFCPVWYTELCFRMVKFFFRLNCNRYKSLTHESQKLIRKLRAEGDVDCRVTLKVKKPGGGYSLLEGLRYIEIRRAGTETLYFITNLDEDELSTSEAAELYSKRWGIETEIGIFKGQDHLPVVRSRLENTVRQEVIVRVMAHNSVRFIQAEACCQHEAQRKDRSTEERQETIELLEAKAPVDAKISAKSATDSCLTEEKWAAKHVRHRGMLLPVDLQFNRTVECTLGYILGELLAPATDPQRAWEDFLEKIAKLKIMAKPGRSYPRRGRKYNKGKRKKGNVKAQRKRARKRKKTATKET